MTTCGRPSGRCSAISRIGGAKGRPSRNRERHADFARRSCAILHVLVSVDCRRWGDRCAADRARDTPPLDPTPPPRVAGDGMCVLPEGAHSAEPHRLPDRHQSAAVSSATRRRHGAEQIRRTAQDFGKYRLVPARQSEVEVSNRRGATVKYPGRPSMQPVHSFLFGVVADFGHDRCQSCGVRRPTCFRHRERQQAARSLPTSIVSAFTGRQTAGSGGRGSQHGVQESGGSRLKRSHSVACAGGFDASLSRIRYIM